MKRFSNYILGLLLATIIQLTGYNTQAQQLYGKRSFEVLANVNRQGPKLAKYFKQKDILAAQLLTLNGIIDSDNPGNGDKIHPPSIRGFFKNSLSRCASKRCDGSKLGN